MISRKDLDQKIDGLKPDENVDFSKLMSQLLPPLDPLKIQQLRDSLSAGEEANPKEVRQILLMGSPEERLALRQACATPRAIARNQDLNLLRLSRALHGDRTAKEDYENNRMIFPEILPEWAAKIWEKNATASWRTLDLHGPKFSNFIRKLNARPEEHFKTVTVDPFNPTAPESADVFLGWRDERATFLTFGNARNYILGVQRQLATSTHTRQALFIVADTEIRKNFRFLCSPTPIGQHYRDVADQELRLLFGAQLVEDSCLALHLPLSEAAKTQVLNKIVGNPWIVIGQLKLHRLIEPVAQLRQEGCDESVIAEHVERFIFVPSALSQFIQDRRPKPSPQAIAPAAPKVEEPWPPPSVIESRRSGLTKALESSPFRDHIDVKRQVRLIMKYAQDSEALFKRAVDLLGQHCPPDGVVAELQIRRSHSAFQPDPRPVLEVAIEAVPPSQAAPASTVQAPTTPSMSAGHSKRLFFRATLEAYNNSSGIDLDRTARILAKLTNESEHLFERALTALERGENPDVVIMDLRNKRAPGSSSSAPIIPPAVMTPAMMELVGIGISAPQRDEMRFSFAKPAEKVIKDGTIRHAVNQALERFSEKQELADIKKIALVEHVWELRLLRENLRVYFMRLPHNEIRVLLIGSKGTQDRDIAQLPGIIEKDREAGVIN